VLCLAGRGPFDALVAAMLGQALLHRGFGVREGGSLAQATAAALPPAPPPAPGSPPAVEAAAAAIGAAATPRLVCLCSIEGGSSGATGRYLLRRTRRRLPQVPVLALAWKPAPEEDAPAAEGALAAALKAEHGTAPLLLATGLVEAVRLVSETVDDFDGPAASPPDAAAEAPAAA
jgi:hypothetical protein